jgi:hypothetical protein
MSDEPDRSGLFLPIGILGGQMGDVMGINRRIRNDGTSSTRR